MLANLNCSSLRLWSGILVVLAAACSNVACDAAATPDGQWNFENVTASSVDRLPGSDYRFDALWTDFNGDGCYDPFIFDHGNLATSRLWLNRCDGSHTFTLVDNDKVHYFIPEPEWPRGSGWLSLLDFNGDGKQDFWTRDASARAARYVNGTAAGEHLPTFSGKQYACNDHCVFGDIDGDNTLDIIHPDRSVESMLTREPLVPATGDEAEVIAADVDGDGWVDVLQPELGGYWHNQQGHLQWQDSVITGIPAQFAVADFDNSGSLDVIIFAADDHGGGQVRLYRNEGDGQFVDVTEGSGLATVRYGSWWTGYGNMVAADFDNDGLQDLMIAGASYQPSVTLLRNLGGMQFAQADVDLGAAGHGSNAFKSRAAVADFDNDGRLDIVKTQDKTNLGIWRNTTDTAGRHWLKVRVRGQGLNSDGVGTVLRMLDTDSGKLLAHMTVRVGEQHPQTWLHTGVGQHAKVDVVVRYPHGGPTYRFNDIAADQELIVFANGCLIQHWQPGEGWPLEPPAGCSQTCSKVSAPTSNPAPRSRPPGRAATHAERGNQAATAARSTKRPPPDGCTTAPSPPPE